MEWEENIGKYVYRVKDSKILKNRIDEGRISFRLNTGSDRHGRLLDPKIEYRFEQEKDWVKIEDIFLTKEDFLNAL
jgi:hypothetical protein